MNVVDVERFGSGARIPIGKQGENLARKIRIGTKGFEDAHEGGTAVLLFRRSANEDPYPVPIQTEDGAVTWQPTAADTARAGFGQMEVQWYVGDILQKSKIYRTHVEKSLEPAGEEPEHPGESWVQQVIEAAQGGADPDAIAELIEQLAAEGKIQTGATPEQVEQIRENTESTAVLKQDLTGLQTNKQDKLIAGAGITIEKDGKTISASGGASAWNHFKVAVEEDAVVVSIEIPESAMEFCAFACVFNESGTARNLRLGWRYPFTAGTRIADVSMTVNTKSSYSVLRGG